jgi:hypothetical protein
MVITSQIWWCRGQVRAENMVVQGTGRFLEPKIWWCRGQVRRKYGGAGDRSAERSKIWWCRGQVKIARPIFLIAFSIFGYLVFNPLAIRINRKSL